MGFLWSPAANIAIFLIIYSYRKYWVWLHMLFFTGATILTLATSLPILFTTGLIAPNPKLPKIRIHYILGISCCAALVLVSLLGGLTKILNILNAKSSIILIIRRIHNWSGYVVVCLFKANIYVMGDAGGWIVVDVISLALYVSWRLMFPKLEAKNITPKYEICPKEISSTKELQKDKGYVVFANLIYDIEPLRYNHPAGYQIV
jgi:Ca2+/Na+ antiporter